MVVRVVIVNTVEDIVVILVMVQPIEMAAVVIRVEGIFLYIDQAEGLIVDLVADLVAALVAVAALVEVADLVAALVVVAAANLVAALGVALNVGRV